MINARSLIPLLFAATFGLARAEGPSLQDIAKAVEPLPKITIYRAKEIVTLDPDRPVAEAVAVVGDRVLATGPLKALEQAAGDQPYVIDERFADHVVVPGLIAQHDHPFLTSLTMTSVIIAIEDWVLPTGTVPAAHDAEEYIARLTAAETEMKDPAEPLITWGYHHLFHGKLSRATLDRISDSRPIIVWHRSCHEFYVNSPAMKTYGLDEKYLATQSKSAQEQSSLEEGHFWEQGVFGAFAQLAPAVASPERIQAGLEFMVRYFHASGVTLGCEPGGLLSKKLQDAQNAVLSGASTPFRYYFIPDGKSLYALDPDDPIGETEKILDWGEGMTAMVPKQVKLFADGAIYSQAMQLRKPYLDGHEGEWMMDLDVFAKAFRAYWEAGYQIHIHVNGDRGVEMVLDNLEYNMRRHPRHDHRTVIVHFAVSAEEQVERIKRLGAIVSANPYYPVALSDRYREVGLGPERADPMARLGDVERAGLSYSLHSDMPMAPGQPLFLMHCAVNRVTPSGRVTAPEQRISREGALRAVTLEAAYALQMEKAVGSIVPGKLANFTILGDNPITCDPAAIKDIVVWGTMHEGRVLPVEGRHATAAARPVSVPRVRRPYNRPSGRERFLSLLRSSSMPHPAHSARVGCTCSSGQRFAEALTLAQD